MPRRYDRQKKNHIAALDHFFGIEAAVQRMGPRNIDRSGSGFDHGTTSNSAISTKHSTPFAVRPESSMITGFFAPANISASSSMPFGSAVASGAAPRSEGILGHRLEEYSMGSDRKTGPRGPPPWRGDTLSES